MSYKEYLEKDLSRKVAGEQGELIANLCLKDFLKGGEFMLHTLLLPLKDGSTTELDNVFISRRGIFVLEIKRWAGTIMGSDEDKKWIQIKQNGAKEIHNPVIQNQAHAEILDKFLNHEYKVENMVIFLNTTNLDHLQSKHACKVAYFGDFYYEHKEIYSIEQLEALHALLKPYVANLEEKEEHIRRLEKKYSH